MSESNSSNSATPSGAPADSPLRRSWSICHWTGHVLAAAAIAVSLSFAADSRRRELAAERDAEQATLEARQTQRNFDRLTQAKAADETEFRTRTELQNRRRQILEEQLRTSEQTAEATRTELAAARGQAAQSQTQLHAALQRAATAESDYREVLVQLVEQAILESTIDVLLTENETLQKRITDLAQAARRLREAASHGKVVGVQPGWGFAVLNLGDKHGTRRNDTFILARDGRAVGRLKVTAVEPNRSIADIVPGSLARGDTVRLGDDVVAWQD